MVVPTSESGRLHANAPGSGALAPDSDFGGISSKCGNVFLKPGQSQALVTESQVGDTSGLDGVSPEESPAANSIVDAHSNEGLPNLDRVLDDERQIVLWRG